MPSSLLPTLTLNLKTDALIHGAKKDPNKNECGPFGLSSDGFTLSASFLFAFSSSFYLPLLDFGSRVLPKDEEMLSILLSLLAILFRHRSTNWVQAPGLSCR